jgi:hypothetical protein
LQSNFKKNQYTMALTLAQKSDWKRGEDEVTDYINRRYKENLGDQFKIVFDKESFPDGEAPYRIASNWGMMAIEGVDNVARKGDAEKEAVRDAVHEIALSFGTPGFSREGNTLKVATDLGKTYNSSTMRDKISEWLMNNL